MKNERVFTELTNAINQFSNLGLDKSRADLQQESHKLTKRLTELEKKCQLLRIMDQELAANRTRIEDLRAAHEKVDIQLIRTKTQQKKLDKNIEKLKSLNESRVRIEVGENDKLKIAKSRAKLSLVKTLSKTFLNSEGKGFSMNADCSDSRSFQLNLNNSREVNRETLWNHIGQSSSYHGYWEQLLAS